MEPPKRAPSWKAPMGRRIAKYGKMLAAGVLVAYPVTALIRGAVSYGVPLTKRPIPAMTAHDTGRVRLSLRPTHFTYTQGEYYTPEWSVGPMAKMRNFIAAGGPKELSKYVSGKNYMVSVEDAAMRAGVSKSRTAMGIKSSAASLGVHLPDHEVVDLARRAIAARSIPERLRPFLLPSELHFGHMETGGRRDPTYLVVHPGVTTKPVPLEIYLRQSHNPEHLKAIGTRLNTLLDAYHTSAPEFFGNVLNLSKPERARFFHSWGKKMRAYSDFGTRNVGVVHTPNGPELKIINPTVLAYSPWKIGIGPILAARYGYVRNMGYVFKLGKDGRYEHVPMQGSVPGEGFGFLRDWAGRMKNGENPLPANDPMVKFHSKYDADLKSLMERMPAGTFHSVGKAKLENL